MVDRKRRSVAVRSKCWSGILWCHGPVLVVPSWNVGRMRVLGLCWHLRGVIDLPRLLGRDHVQRWQAVVISAIISLR